MDFPDFFSMVSKDGPLAKTLPSSEHSFLVLDGRVLEKKSTSVSESQSVSWQLISTKDTDAVVLCLGRLVADRLWQRLPGLPWASRALDESHKIRTRPKVNRESFSLTLVHFLFYREWESIPGLLLGIDSIVSSLVWIGHVFSWVLPLVLGLDAWVFFSPLQTISPSISCQTIWYLI